MLGEWLRTLAKHYGLSANRRPFHDAWNEAMPWARVVELTAAAGASAVAIARLRQLGELAFFGLKADQF